MPHPVSRDVTDPAFPHGTERGYDRGCKCIGCRRGHNKATTARAMRAAAGVPYLVPSEGVRRHVVDLLAKSNLEYGEVAVVARAANVSIDLVHGLQRGEHPTMTREYADRLLRLTPDDLRGAATWVPAKVPVQQYRSLQAMGWPGPILADRLGYTGQACPPWIGQHRLVVHRRTSDRMQALYDQLGGTFGPSEQSRQLARKRGWYTPLAYDDNGDLIPDAVRPPEGSLAARRLQRAEVIRLLDEEPQPSAAEIAMQTGLSERSVMRINQQRREAEHAEAAS